MTTIDKMTPVQQAAHDLDYARMYYPLPTADEVVDAFDAFCDALENIREHISVLGFVASIGVMTDDTEPLDRLLSQLGRDLPAAAAGHTAGDHRGVVAATLELLHTITDGPSFVSAVDEKRRSVRQLMRDDFARYASEGGEASWSVWSKRYGSDYGWRDR